MKESGKYFYALENGKVFFKLTGTLRYSTSGKFDFFLDKWLAKNSDFEDVLIDLSEADFLDSTNLGLLARISEFASEKTDKKVTILSTNEEINKTLESVGFDEVFLVVKSMDCGSTAEFSAADCPEDVEERKQVQIMLDAHKALIRVSDKNKDVFSNVVDLLEESSNNKE